MTVQRVDYQRLHITTTAMGKVDLGACAWSTCNINCMYIWSRQRGLFLKLWVEYSRSRNIELKRFTRVGGKKKKGKKIKIKEGDHCLVLCVPSRLPSFTD